MTRWGNFELLEEIGHGSFGAVYRSVHPTLAQPVALKLVPVSGHDPRAVEKALEEARRLASVRHPHVVTVHDAQYIDGYVGICMDYVDGRSLDAVVAERGTYDPQEAATCIRALAGALSAVHRAHIVHNDVKAKNAMREAGGRVVLMDFGAGRRIQDPNATTSIAVVGTLPYMAPEIFQLRETTPVSDIYSLGVLWFYLLTGQYPVTGATLHELAEAHSRPRSRFIADFRHDVPAGLQRVIDKTLAPAPADRYQSCGELLSDLDSQFGHTGRDIAPLRVPPAPAPEPFRVTPAVVPRSVPLTALIGTLAVVATLGAIGFMASSAYDIMFSLDGEFARESPFVWLETGAKTLPLPLFYAIAALVLWNCAAFLWRLGSRNSRLVGTLSLRTSTALRQASRRVRVDDAASLATLLLIVQCAVLLLLIWSSQDLITAFLAPVADGVIPNHALLSVDNDGRWIFFRGVMCLLTLAGGYAWWNVMKYRRAADMGFTRLTAGIAVTAVSLALATVPWRIIQDSKFETATYASRRCFIVAEKAPRVQLYCPGAAPTTLVISDSDVRLVRLGTREYLFSSIFGIGSH